MNRCGYECYRCAEEGQLKKTCTYLVGQRVMTYSYCTSHGSMGRGLNCFRRRASDVFDFARFNVRNGLLEYGFTGILALETFREC